MNYDNSQFKRQQKSEKNKKDKQKIKHGSKLNPNVVILILKYFKGLNAKRQR